ncbi:MAG TPA: DUF192 domain-containing protein [Hydrogenophaga sp.]|jgi:uncharacterized membrane protein (UPF0127 family)|uniref:DUF192 domain-containing protein n=1 Tax=Hydrogenophaga sp. TaxID=1904254 RepID=UPI002C1E87EB|nr:DUF192 domain-containing protein [Hydrogenophaga sp.]HMN91723.1 DUF192 domain-containing protein [Hydrogenophaga sp.]HMP10559.1 DUF192 domain-containing protein [Hydrogenophaga sp.]
MPFNETATLYTALGPCALRLRTARGWWSRLRGLMLAAPLRTEPVVQALLIPRCPSVHGFFMRYALDIVYLHRDHRAMPHGSPQDRYRVTYVTRLDPWRVSIGRRWAGESGTVGRALRSQHALELPAGMALAMGVAPGDWLEVLTCTVPGCSQASSHRSPQGEDAPVSTPGSFPTHSVSQCATRREVQ